MASGLVVLLAAACGDRCDVLCADVSRSLATCKGDVTWQDLDARSRVDFAGNCRDEWEALRSGLDGWEIEVALNECGQAQEVLADLQCDAVMALYDLDSEADTSGSER